MSSDPNFVYLIHDLKHIYVFHVHTYRFVWRVSVYASCKVGLIDFVGSFTVAKWTNGKSGLESALTVSIAPKSGVVPTIG